MVFANAYVFTRIVYGAALANQNIARFGNLSPKSFTPKRLLSDSRPFLELPTPFLCAISVLRF